MPPLDENGLPKYKGKKRGRKPKEKKRRVNPDRPKRGHTGYTLFMQEGYPSVKREYPDLSSKELIRLVARRWKDLSTESKAVWKERAQQEQRNEQEVVADNRDVEAIGEEDNEVDGILGDD